MIDLNSVNGDLELSGLDLQLVDGTNQIAQHLEFRLKFFQNDWFLDIFAGLPYFDDILVKSPNRIRVESLLKQEILDTENIDQLLDFSSEFNNSNRKFSVKFTVLVNQQQIDLEFSLP